MLSLRLITIETKRKRDRKRKNGQHARTEEEEEEERETKELAFSRPQRRRKKEKKIDPSVGRSSVGRRRLRGVDFAFENTERTHLNLHPFCICGYYILKFLCENSRAVVVERVFPAARAKKE